MIKHLIQLFNDLQEGKQDIVYNGREVVSSMILSSHPTIKQLLELEDDGEHGDYLREDVLSSVLNYAYLLGEEAGLTKSKTVTEVTRMVIEGFTKDDDLKGSALKAIDNHLETIEKIETEIERVR